MEIKISSNSLDIPETSFLIANNSSLYILFLHMNYKFLDWTHIKCVPVISSSAHVRCTHFCNFCDIVIYKGPGSKMPVAEHSFRAALQGLAPGSKWLASACFCFQFMVENQENFPNVSSGTEVDPLLFLPVWDRVQILSWIVSQTKQTTRRHLAQE